VTGSRLCLAVYRVTLRAFDSTAYGRELDPLRTTMFSSIPGFWSASVHWTQASTP
jgi:hypothetical protein